MESNGRRLTVYRRGNMKVMLNHSGKRIRVEEKREVVLSTYLEHEKGVLKPWEGIIVK